MYSRAQEVGDYILGRTLGSGTTGKVKIAVHKETGQQVAIKIIKKSQFETRPDLRSKIQREIALMRLLDHPHLMKLHEVCESTKHLYLVLEYCSNGELFDYLVARKHLEPELAVHLFRELIYGLDYLHAHAMCHRDLKPENILLDENDHIKIADFGFARWMRTNIAETSCGSPHYAAPEVVKGLHYDGRAADVWSCGVILYALLAGRLPFDDPSVRTLLAKVKSGKYVMPDFPRPLQDLISRMIEVDVKKRITIPEIKQHPAFMMTLPSDYCIPTPLPIPIMEKPLDTALIDGGILSILKGIGYASDEDIMREITSNSHTSAKVFYEMYQRHISVEYLPWEDEGSVYSNPDEMFMMSPKLIGGGQMQDPFRRNEKVFSPDISSPDIRSVAHRASGWDVAFAPELDGDCERIYDPVTVQLEVLMTTLQKWLTENDFKWFHPDDMQLVAKLTGHDFFMTLKAEYGSAESVQVTATLLRDQDGDFTRICDEIQGVIDCVNDDDL